MSETFRLGVGALIVAADGLVLAIERADVAKAWQLPQGGVERGEDLRTAVLREVEEELGLRETELFLIDEHPIFLGYELPLDLQRTKTGRGQCHRWFLFGLAPNAAPGIGTSGEVRRHGWMHMEDLVAEAAEFRRPVYRELARYFRAHLRQRSEPDEDPASPPV